MLYFLIFLFSADYTFSHTPLFCNFKNILTTCHSITNTLSSSPSQSMHCHIPTHNQHVCWPFSSELPTFNSLSIALPSYPIPYQHLNTTFQTSPSYTTTCPSSAHTHSSLSSKISYPHHHPPLTPLPSFTSLFPSPVSVDKVMLQNGILSAV